MPLLCYSVSETPWFMKKLWCGTWVNRASSAIDMTRENYKHFDISDKFDGWRHDSALRRRPYLVWEKSMQPAAIQLWMMWLKVASFGWRSMCMRCAFASRTLHAANAQFRVRCALLSHLSRAWHVRILRKSCAHLTREMRAPRDATEKMQCVMRAPYVLIGHITYSQTVLEIKILARNYEAIY
jgi:hypothetical protein